MSDLLKHSPDCPNSKVHGHSDLPCSVSCSYRLVYDNAPDKILIYGHTYYRDDITGGMIEAAVDEECHRSIYKKQK